jgi:hypothetical protein
MLGLRRVGIAIREPGAGVEDGSPDASTLPDEERRGGDEESICELSVSAIPSLVQYQAGWSESFTATLQYVWPALPSVKYRDQFYAVAMDSIWNYVRKAGDNELPSARDAAWPAEIRMLGQSFHRFQYFYGHPGG